MNPHSPFLLAGLLIVGCSDSHLDDRPDSGNDDIAASAAGGSATEERPFSEEQTKIVVDDTAGRLDGIWLGQTRDPVACAPSLRVALRVMTDDKGVMRAEILFGEGDPPTRFTASDSLPFSDAVDDMPWDGTTQTINGRVQPCELYRPTDGYAHTVIDGTIDDHGRFVFFVAVLERFEAWCKAQPPSCLPELDHTEFDGCPAECPVSEFAWTMCSHWGPHCDCRTDDGCRANLGQKFRIDMTVQEDEMAGFISGWGGAATEVRLRHE